LSIEEGLNKFCQLAIKFGASELSQSKLRALSLETGFGLNVNMDAAVIENV